MSNRYKNPFIFYNDNLGNTLPRAELYFYENRTTTLQNVYADPELTQFQAVPVIADDDGNFPEIWLLDELYTVELQDTRGNLIRRVDDFNFEILRPLSKGPLIVETLDDLKSGTLIDGTTVNWTIDTIVDTLGYNSSKDGQAGRYQIISSGSGTTDDGTLIKLDNGLEARLINLQNMSSTTSLGEGDVTLVYGKDPYFILYDDALTSSVSITLEETFVGNGEFSINLRGSEGAFVFGVPQLDVTLTEKQILKVQSFDGAWNQIIKQDDL